jgi:amino acid permease
MIQEIAGRSVPLLATKEADDGQRSNSSSSDSLLCLLGGAPNNPLAKFRQVLAHRITPGFEQPTGVLEKETSVIIRKNSQVFNGAEAIEASLGARKVGLLRPMQPSSVRACVITLMATALGSGVLTLPYAFSKVGVVLGIVLLTVAAFLGSLSLMILMVSSRYAEAESYSQLLVLATGWKSAGSFLNFVLAVYGTAALLALLIFEGDFLPAIAASLGYELGRTQAILAAAVTVWPLVLPEKVSALRYVAAVSPFAILFVAGNVIVQEPLRAQELEKFAAAASRNNSLAASETLTSAVANAMQAATIFAFSVMCHMSAVPVGYMLERPSVARIVKVAWYTNAGCWCLYLLIGVGGYLSFQNMVKGDFLLNYSVDNMPILCCRFMMAIVCWVGIPMNSGPAAQALQKLLTGGMDRPAMHAALASVLLVAATGMAIVLRNVATVISIVGGSLTTLQMFWLPCLIYIRILYPSQPIIFRRIIVALLLVGGVTGFTSVVLSISAALQ